MDARMINGPDIPCGRCGYDLRATAAGGSCPECGLPVSATVGGVRVHGKRLVVKSGAVLPPVCIKTGEPIDVVGKTKTLYWAPPWIYLTLLAGVFVTLIVYLVARKPCQVTYAIGPAARKRKARRMTMAGAVAVLGVVVLMMGVNAELPWLIVAGVVTALGGLIAMAALSNDIALIKHRRGEFWIKGCGQPFLDSIGR